MASVVWGPFCLGRARWGVGEAARRAAASATEGVARWGRAAGVGTAIVARAAAGYVRIGTLRARAAAAMAGWVSLPDRVANAATSPGTRARAVRRRVASSSGVAELLAPTPT
jgi:hypothetical protein